MIPSVLPSWVTVAGKPRASGDDPFVVLYGEAGSG